jgi:uncharacterized membrane-anchored protein
MANFIKHAAVIFVLFLGAGFLLRADTPPPSQDSLAALASSLKWQTGAVELQGGLAKINLSGDYRFLGHEDSQKVLHDIWGNPPDPTVLGMIFPANLGPLDPGSWGIVITYEEDGYVKDTDADQIKYDDLLKQMQQQSKDDNAEREKEGYPSIDIVGWAAPPRYDKAAHKLYWAKDLKFGNDPADTLNYCIRILGRRGVLQLNVVASMPQFADIDKQVPTILSMVDFQPGNQYADFDPKIDKIAEYGLATLVAGGALGAAAKLGLLAGLWKFIIWGFAAFYKLIIVGVVAVSAFFKNLWAKMSGKRSTPDHLLPPPGPGGPGL